MKKGPQPKTSSPEQHSPSSSASSLDKTSHQVYNTSSSSSSIKSTSLSSHRHNPYQTTTPSSLPSSHYDISNNSSEPAPFNYQIIDLYFDVVSVGCPVLQRDAMLMICSKRPEENSKAEEVAMLYAIQALCYQRLGRKLEGRASFKMARKFLSDVFDILDNFQIAATFLYLANFCIGEGEPNQAKYYLNSVQFFIDQNKEQLANDELFGNLCKMFMYIGLLMKEDAVIFSNDEGLQEGVGTDLKKQLILSEKALVVIYQFFVFFTQHISDGECGKTVPPSTSESILQEYILTINSQAIQYNRYQLESSPAKSSVHKLLHLFIIDGLRLGILLKSPNNADDAIIEIANRVTNYSTLMYFPYLPSHIISVVANAARVHLAIVKQIQRRERFDNGVDYHDIIRKDHRALTILADRYTIAENKARTLVKQLRDELVERENQLARMYRQPTQQQSLPQYSAIDLPNVIPNDEESSQRLEEMLANNPGIDKLPPLPSSNEEQASSPFLDFDFFTPSNSENFYTDPQMLL
ncbi:predicted protein [Naegleria gruberi]|uniref:Predicted protein n=1 Tax=Naegleria gruberi TaxID=5762 RepID=D2VE66_NAEGR|nr:uncharacterized protein NAEGRDRAFT_57939 [Naegleria gruberi]EFC44742.1 predicted protein [Naegleria gruberi]|eukprot:XP_002677486.1 predicted protein [Naegleria gruberi strain NEG-M]